ncbi:hypothetical protein [Natrinema sp. 1APR25-10V2]|uniref:hypothetical protein n=1 Tax=Natrinema sp. 1APR25-10V2 TaxID=2951081 RepID=UPI002874F270|nr:hypothetical protein [Natrinema sp. 1APR25-10V2]MDS0474791.1 hypothetical protein [Natrinema sp. 1APR25-10V2]
MEIPYEIITRTNAEIDGLGTITVYAEGIKHEFTLAATGDEENAREAYAYLREQVFED